MLDKKKWREGVTLSTLENYLPMSGSFDPYSLAFPQIPRISEAFITILIEIFYFRCILTISPSFHSCIIIFMVCGYGGFISKVIGQVFQEIFIFEGFGIRMVD